MDGIMVLRLTPRQFYALLHTAVTMRFEGTTCSELNIGGPGMIYVSGREKEEDAIPIRFHSPTATRDAFVSLSHRNATETQKGELVKIISDLTGYEPSGSDATVTRWILTRDRSER